ncbi:cilia- and flagella-associated protein 157-like [Brachyistius frenatus]|uniref:cilia- and flagella-associated protein 157-like n=1 Tax=Brachyistius frenatus TaxID=100188 RepID=UPI0037E77330
MADNIGSDDKEKSFHLIQIRCLEEQLEGCRLKCDELGQQEEDLVSQYNTLEKEKTESTKGLKRLLTVKEKKAVELVEQLKGEKQVAKQDRETLKLQHSQQMQDLTHKLNSEDMMVVKLEEQQNQLMRLMQQLSDVESQEKQLANQNEEQEATIQSLKMEVVKTREKNIEDFHNFVKTSITCNTSRILQKERARHIHRLQQLQNLRSQSERLPKEVEALQVRENDICLKRNDLKKGFDKITQQRSVLDREVEQLWKKCQQLMVDIKNDHIAQLSSWAETETLSDQLMLESNECRKTSAMLEELRAELQEERRRRRQLERVQREATIIHTSLDFESGSETQLKIERLLKIVESSAPQGTVEDRNF